MCTLLDYGVQIYCVMCAGCECAGGCDMVVSEWVDVMFLSEWVDVMVVSGWV